MKSIEEASSENINKIRVNAANLDHIKSTGRINGSLHIDLMNLSKSMVEFAQRWIPVEEELPESSDELLLVKYKDAKGNDKYGMAKYFDMSIFRKNKLKCLNFTIQGSCPRNVTHWRHIELK